MGIYALQQDVVDYIEGFVIDSPEALERLIARAELMIDEHLPPATYVNGRKFDPTAVSGGTGFLDVDPLNALKRATCAQVEYILYLGSEAFVEDRIHEGVNDPKAITKPRRLAPKAQYELVSYGFIPLTGRLV